ncbi:MAG: DinB family protein [Candidatus Dormibacteraeota bacterium]|nr:DinB family protein [Candidatus Dormibacteraeota bacterium]
MAVDKPASVARFYRGWANYQRQLVTVFAPLEPAHLQLQAAPSLWSIGMIGSHVVSARAWWFNFWMKEGGQELEDFIDWDEGEDVSERSGAEIVRALEVTWGLIESRLAAWTPADLDKQFQRPTPNEAGKRPRRTREWIIWHVLEHDIHHGGEISFSLGIHGLEGIDL